jgi:hypothetical protein
VDGTTNAVLGGAVAHPKSALCGVGGFFFACI